MNGGLPVASLFGFEIRVSLSLAVMTGVVALIAADQAAFMTPASAGAVQWVVGAAVAVLYLLSVLVHELAHAIVGRRRGVSTPTLVLGLAGGLAPLSVQAARPGDELAIAASGPLVSVAIAAVLLPAALALSVAAAAFDPVSTALFIVGVLNLMLGLASLLPALPLDGGRLVRAIAWARTGDPDRAALASARAGRYLGWVVSAIGIVLVLVADAVLGVMLVAMGWLLGGASRGLEQRAQLERLLRGVTVADAMVTDVPHIGPGLTLDTFADRLGAGGAPRALPVVDGDRVLGVIGFRALRRLSAKRLASARAADVMATPPDAPFVAPAEGIWGVLETMQRRGLDGLAVVEEGRLVGMVTRESAGEVVRARMPAVMFWRGRGR